MKQNGRLYAEYKMKECERKRLAKEDGKVKGRGTLTPRDLRAVRKSNKVAVIKYRKAKREAAVAAKAAAEAVRNAETAAQPR